MKHKTIQLAGVKTAGLAEGEFIGYASTFGNIDSQGDRVMKGAFAKSIASDTVVPIAWEHLTSDPRNLVGEIKTARETDEGLEIHAVLDLDTEHGKAAYRAVKSRRVKSLSIGYGIRNSVKSSVDGARELTDLDLMEVSLVSRPANTEARITESKGVPAKLVKARAALAATEGKAAGTVDDEQDESTNPADDTSLTLGERLVAALEAATDAAKALIATAEDGDRDLTDDEAAEVEKNLDKAKSARREIAAWNKSTPEARHGSQYIVDVAAGKGRTTPEEFERRWADRTKFAPVQIGTKTRTTSHKAKEATSMDTQYFNIGGHGRKAAAAAIAAKIHGTDQPWGTGGDTGGTKALTTSGQVVTDTPMATVVVPTGRPATSLLDVIPSNRLTTPTYSYLRQNSRALAAAAVAQGAVKPTSAVGTETVTNTASVVAHLSEPVDKFVMADAPQLQRFLGDEMLYGLDLAIQAQALSGNGTAPNQKGILATSGIQVQAFATDILTTVRKAITSAEALGYAPSVLVVSPGDWEAIELLATTAQAIAFRGVPIDQGERKIWGLTAVLALGLPAKTALVLDPAALSIDSVGGVEIEWAKESGELFSRNQIQVRVETRIGVSIFQPAAITKVATAA